MDAIKLLEKIIEKDLSITNTLELFEIIGNPEQMTIGEAMQIKRLLGLTNVEAVEIFFT